MVPVCMNAVIDTDTAKAGTVDGRKVGSIVAIDGTIVGGAPTVGDPGALIGRAKTRWRAPTRRGLPARVPWAAHSGRSKMFVIGVDDVS